MLSIHWQWVECLQALHRLFLQSTFTLVPIGAQRFGYIGRIGGYRPMAFLFSTAAICNTPVEQATKQSALEIEAIISSRENSPVRSCTLVWLALIMLSLIWSPSAFVPVIKILYLSSGSKAIRVLKFFS